MSHTSLNLSRGRWSIRGGVLVDPRRLEAPERGRARHFLERLPIDAIAQEFLRSGGFTVAATGDLEEIARYLHLPAQSLSDASAVVREIERAVHERRLVLLRNPRSGQDGGPAIRTELEVEASAKELVEKLGTFALQYEVDDLELWFDTKVTLSADDGSYSAEWHLVAAEDETHPPSRFVFTGLPVRATYTLRIEETGAPARLLFQGVSYDEMGGAEWRHHHSDSDGEA